MNKIYKYQLPDKDSSVVFEMPMPRHAEILCVQVQRDIPCLWARVDDQAPIVNRRFRLCVTGGEAPLDGKYVETFQLFGGRLVLHLFEVLS